MYLPTPEQVFAADTFKSGLPTKVLAFAGAGKTSTLQLMGRTRSYHRGLYIAFNKAIATEAQEKFIGTGVQAKTAHALAFGVVKGMGYSPEKMTGYVRSRDFRFTSPWMHSQPDDVRVSESTFRTLVGATIAKFCQSWDQVIDEKHVPMPDGFDDATESFLYSVVPSAAMDIWDQMRDPSNRQPMGHDGYLKVWALSRPRIFGDFLMVDEAQDLNGVLIGVVREQQQQVISVGDSHQQIYAWRGARDALRILPGTECRLTQSFRFGPAIANAANMVLMAMGETHPLRGCNVEDMVSHDYTSSPDAVLCRSNAGVIGQAIEWHERGRDVHTPGGTGEMRALVQDAETLQRGGTPVTQDLMAFETWRDVQDYAGTDEGRGMRVFVNLVDRYGTSRLNTILGLIRDRPTPGCLTVSTGHKAKGLEWNTVQIHDDFLGSVGDEEGPDLEERRLFYVAMTRARRALHLSDELLAAFSAPMDE